MSEPPPPSRPPLPKAIGPAIRQKARQLVDEPFAKCFWFRHPNASIRTPEDVYLIIEHLREYGGHREWKQAQDLWEELQSCR